MRQSPRELRCRGKVRRKAFRASLLIWAMFLPAAARCEEPPAKGTLSGRIVDAQGMPVAAARIWIGGWDDKLLAECVGDADGRFRLGPLEAVYRHDFDLYVEADGFARQYAPSGTYSIFPNADCDLGAIRVDRGCSFTGQVLDRGGTPVADADVECSVDRCYLGHTVSPIGPPQLIKTDAVGRFRTPPLGIGERGLIVRAPHRQIKYVELPDAASGERILPPIVVDQDTPILGTVTDSQGSPIAGAEVRADPVARSISDKEGQFVLSGFGPSPSFQLQASKDGYVFINWKVKGDSDGFRWRDIGRVGNERGPAKRLAVVMVREAWIEGTAVDEATGQPVRLDRVVLCFFERKPGGEAVLNGCRSSRFEQAQDGSFRVPYWTPDEYHLTFSAAGYHDAEAFTPKVGTLAPVEGIRVKMRKKQAGSVPSLRRQTISGMVTDRGRPVETGWVGLWSARAPQDVANAYVMRGRTVAGDPVIHARAPLRDGKYSLTVPFQDEGFYLVAESPGLGPTQIGPIGVTLGEEKSLDIACVESGAIQGTVKDRPAGWEDDLWVVAFTDAGVRVERRVARDGSFNLPNLPPGRYGLKVGHDAYLDSDVPRGADIPPEAWKTVADPWKRAVVVDLAAGQECEGIELTLPQD